MLDMKFLRENPDQVKENIKKKFQDEKLPLVDVIELDAKNRAAITEASELRASRNALSKQIGMLMGQAKKDPSKLEEAEKIKATVKANADRLAELEKLEEEYEQKIHKIMLLIPNIIDPSVPIGSRARTSTSSARASIRWSAASSAKFCPRAAFPRRSRPTPPASARRRARTASRSAAFTASTSLKSRR